MAALKTQATDTPIKDYVAALPVKRQPEAQQLISGMPTASCHPPVIRGSRIAGFERCTDRDASGQTGEWPRVGFGKGNGGMRPCSGVNSEQVAEPLARLGAPRHVRGCLYLKRLDGVDAAILQDLIARLIVAHAHQRVDGVLSA
jgi:hypothetical protein